MQKFYSFENLNDCSVFYNGHKIILINENGVEFSTVIEDLFPDYDSGCLYEPEHIAEDILFFIKCNPELKMAIERRIDNGIFIHRLNVFTEKLKPPV